MPWKILPNGAKLLVRPTKYEKHLMLYPSAGLSARALQSLKQFPNQVVKMKTIDEKERDEY